MTFAAPTTWGPLDTDDFRALARLLAQGIGVHDDAPLLIKRRRLLGGLCKLLEARECLWTLSPRAVSGPAPRVMTLRDPPRRGQAGGTAQDAECFHQLVAARHGTGVVVDHLATPTFLTLQAWRAAKPARHPAEWLVGANAAGADGRTSLIGVARPADQGPFGERQRALLGTVIVAVRWLHLSSRPPRPRGSLSLEGLPPRLHQVLTLALRGDSAKQIARQMDLSVHTVHQYMRALCRRFEVRTRSQLLAKFVSGQGIWP